jgi:hypothetical protein
VALTSTAAEAAPAEDAAIDPLALPETVTVLKSSARDCHCVDWQARAYDVPYCFVCFGNGKGIDEETITAMNVESVQASLEPGSAAQLTMLIAENKVGFTFARAAFGSAFSTYSATAKGMARDVLQAVLFMHMGAPRDLIRQDIGARINTIHWLLGLADGQACIDTGHPLLGEYNPI